MTDKPEPSWLVTLRRAADRSLSFITVQNRTLVGATKVAEAEIKSKEGGPYRVVSVEAAPVKDALDEILDGIAAAHEGRAAS
jgi:hypothetical protein